MFINWDGRKLNEGAREFNTSVLNQYTNTRHSGVRVQNNWGFPASEDFDFAGRPIDKKPNEKIVLFAGGSAAAGAGATSNDHLITAYMERILNSEQNTIRYRALNFGNGGWIAAQEFISLGLWGRTYNPDWVITMDGRNDIAVAFHDCEGPGNPLHCNNMKSYIQGYLVEGRGTSFYRGWLENQLIKYSMVYRTITGKLYIPNNRNLLEFYGSTRMVEPFKGDQVPRIIQFYVNTLENIVCLFPKAKYIITLQPLAIDYADIFGLSEEQIDVVRNLLKTAECGPKDYGGSMVLFWNQVVKDVPSMLSKYSRDKTCIFKNMRELFPKAGAQRRKFFLDEVHMPDAGQELVAIYYAYTILASDFPEKAEQYSSVMQSKIDELVAKTPAGKHQ